MYIKKEARIDDPGFLFYVHPIERQIIAAWGA